MTKRLSGPEEIHGFKSRKNPVLSHENTERHNKDKMKYTKQEVT